MKIRFLFFAVLIAILAAVGPAAADRNILTPTGETLATAKFRAEAVIDPSETDNRVIWAAVGISRFELEAQRVETEEGLKQDTFNLEAALLPQTTLTPAIGVGVIDVTNKIDRGMYIAATKRVPLSSALPTPISDIRLTAGLGTGPIKGLFAGAEATVMSLRLQAEYDGDDFNAAIGIPILGAATAKAMWIKDDFYIGVEFKPRF